MFKYNILFYLGRANRAGIWLRNISVFLTAMVIQPFGSHGQIMF